MTSKRRLIIAIITGSILGIFCIIGVGGRLGISGNEVFLIGMWYNRVIMGAMIGLSGEIVIIKNSTRKGLYTNSFIRGILIGFAVSLAIFLSSEFKDFLGFLAGIVYGPIIDFVATWFEETSAKK